MTIGWIIFITVYFVLAIGELPYFKVDRTGVALIGAISAIAFQAISEKDAFLSIDYSTIVLLFSMMIIVAFFITTGFFQFIKSKLSHKIKSKDSLLFFTIFASGISSALFINDIICIIFPAIILSFTKQLKLNPLPYMLAIAMASNIGSLMTPIGNPQNIFIASQSHIPYSAFVKYLAPISIVNLFILFYFLKFFFKKKFFTLDNVDYSKINEEEHSHPVHLFSLIKSLVITLVIIILFWIGKPLSIVSASGAAILLLTRNIKREKIFALIDWNIIILFVSLFIITKTASNAGIINYIYIQLTKVFSFENYISYSALTAMFSNTISNVPAVFFLGEIISKLNNPNTIWMLTAIISTLAGNLFVIGSIANIIVVERSKVAIKISFLDYAKVGVPITIITLITSIIYFYILPFKF